MSEAKVNKKRIGLLAIEIIVLGVYAVLCEFLYYMQTLKLPHYLYESDLPYHIEMALDGWGYSVTAILYRFLSQFSNSGHLIAIFLSICTIATILITYKAVEMYMQEEWQCFAIAMISGLVMPFYISTAHITRYIGYQSGNIWHNSTYIVMKLFAAMTLMAYFVIAKRYATKLTVKDWIVFSLLLVLTTATKTSFILVFAPAALVMLLVDLYLKVPLRKVFLVALTIVPTLLVIFLQQTVLFGGETGNGIAIDFAYAIYLTTGRPYLTMPLSLLFPIIVLLANAWPVLKQTLKDLKKREKSLQHRELIMSWLMWGFAFLEYAFLKETGERFRDGNFSWGYDLVVFILFVVSMVYFVKNLKDKEFAPRPLRIIYGICAGGVLGYHLYCGVYFFSELLTGRSYFM